ncbi:hypothetical protein FGO68_gene11831 [Halteria grandinella]|uniref:Uncharacterized protein n=1 Tax=Halteria grandinella TaxID=5974 RepID=A0A8J8NAN4_HALGN|nr:hypothetical protein FGO68_gene11831 [Halteria grandinella]
MRSMRRTTWLAPWIYSKSLRPWELGDRKLRIMVHSRKLPRPQTESQTQDLAVLCHKKHQRVSFQTGVQRRNYIPSIQTRVIQCSSQRQIPSLWEGLQSVNWSNAILYILRIASELPGISLLLRKSIC